MSVGVCVGLTWIIRLGEEQARMNDGMSERSHTPLGFVCVCEYQALKQVIMMSDVMQGKLMKQEIVTGIAACVNCGHVGLIRMYAW